MKNVARITSLGMGARRAGHSDPSALGCSEDTRTGTRGESLPRTRCGWPAPARSLAVLRAPYPHTLRAAARRVLALLGDLDGRVGPLGLADAPVGATRNREGSGEDAVAARPQKGREAVRVGLDVRPHVEGRELVEVLGDLSDGLDQVELG